MCPELKRLKMASLNQYGPVLGNFRKVMICFSRLNKIINIQKEKLPDADVCGKVPSLCKEGFEEFLQACNGSFHILESRTSACSGPHEGLPAILFSPCEWQALHLPATAASNLEATDRRGTWMEPADDTLCLLVSFWNLRYSNQKIILSYCRKLENTGKLKDYLKP